MRILVLLCLLFIGCEDLGAPFESVSARIVASRLIVTNHSFKVVYYAIFERQSLELINWAAICGPGNAIHPSLSITVQVTDSSFLPSNEAVVYWWHQGKKYEGSDSYGPDEIRAFVLKVR